MGDREEQFLSMNRAGMTARQIAEQLHVDVRTVTRWRTRLGVNKGEVKQRTPDELREIAHRIVLDGGSFTDAAETIGVRAQTVRGWFPEIPAWTRSQAGAYAAQVRRFNKVTTETRAA